MAQFTRSLLILLCSLFCFVRGEDTIIRSNDCNKDLETQHAVAYQNVTSLLDTILARGYLKVGTTGDYRPFSYLTSNISNPGDNSTYIGADIDQARSLSSALNLPGSVHFIPTSFANLSSDLADNKFDIAMSGISITTARAQNFFFSIPYQPVGEVACVLCSNVQQYTGGLSSIDKPEVLVAVNAGGENERFDRANLKKARLVVVQSNGELYQTLLNGKADVVISDMVEVTLESKLSNGTSCVANPVPFNFVEKGYQMNRDLVWKNFIDTWLHIQVASGAWNRTLEKWFHVPVNGIENDRKNE